MPHAARRLLPAASRLMLAAILLSAATFVLLEAQGVTPATPLTVVTRDGRRPLHLQFHRIQIELERHPASRRHHLGRGAERPQEGRQVEP